MQAPEQLATFLADVEQSLGSALEDGEGIDRGDTLMGAARHLCLAGGGKRARPLLVKIFGAVCGAPQSALLDVAVAAELIHSASLLHDDVVDHGMFRRGRPTVNARWGNVVAVMTGDMLLAGALGRLAGLDARITREAIELVAEMTRAAILEVESRGDLSLPLDRLRVIHEGKTGALFGWCGVAAARVAGDVDAARHFDRFGRHLGVAFQIADDVRDVAGGDDGKPRYADLSSRSPSMPVLLAVARDSALRRRVLDLWSFPSPTPERVREVGTAVVCSGVLEEAVSAMRVEVNAAVEALGPYSEAPCARQLVGWAEGLLQSLTAKGSA